MSDLPSLEEIQQYLDEAYDGVYFDPENLEECIEELNENFTQEDLWINFSGTDSSYHGLPEFLKQVELKLEKKPKFFAIEYSSLDHDGFEQERLNLLTKHLFSTVSKQTPIHMMLNRSSDIILEYFKKWNSGCSIVS